MRNAVIATLIQPAQCPFPLPPSTAFANKTAIVTGGNSGIGYEGAQHLVLRGATVILAVRDISKGEQAKANMISKLTSSSATATPKLTEEQLSTRIKVWNLDLSSFRNVKEFVSRVNTEIQQLDYVFLNAGVATKPYSRTEDDWETMLQVNGLSTALMALLFLPKLIAQARRDQTNLAEYDPPRIIITASGLHATIPFGESQESKQIEHHQSQSNTPILATLNSESNFHAVQKQLGPHAQYSTTKLLNVYTAQRIAPLIPKLDDQRPLVIVNCLCPGFCKSELQREGLPFPVNILRTVVGRTTEMGSRNLLAAAKTLGVESHGQFVMDCKVTASGGMALSEEGRVAGDKVWAEMIEVLRRVAPEVSLIVNGQF